MIGVHFRGLTPMVDRVQSVEPTKNVQIAVVIPCYRVKRHVLNVIAGIGPEVHAIYIVDDKCPEGSGRFVQENVTDPRVRVLFHDVNKGVGGATLTGMCRAADDGNTVVVKLDGDGQLAPALVNRFVRPILRGSADYTKGNRYYELERLKQMPMIRLFGNAVLSFISKVSSGYWDSFDPTNGYIAVHTRVLKELPISKISCGYFFESDMLFRLYLARAVVLDIPMYALYGDEKSNLKITKIMGPFMVGHVRNFCKRIFYSYFLRDFSIASVYLILGLVLSLFGGIFGATKWYHLAQQGIEGSAGTVMLAGLPVIIGFQLLIGFMAFDVENVPRIPLQSRLLDG